MYQDQFSTPIGFVHIKANDEGLTYVGFDNNSLQAEQINANIITSQAKSQLQEYFSGARHDFDLPLAPKGTEFQRSVWRALQALKFGETVSYLHIAKALNKPKACRAVGAANGKNPISIIIPCHRVIGSSGKLTGYAGGLDRKTFLLDLEARQG